MANGINLNGNAANWVKALAQAGLAGVAIFALWITWQISKDANDAIRGNTKVLSKLEGMISVVLIRRGEKLKEEVLDAEARLPVKAALGATVLPPANESGISNLLKKIARCESEDRHFDDKGSVIVSETGDIGRYQINQKHTVEAEQMGLDLWDEEDNERYARHLLGMEGTDPWSRTKECWDK